MSGQHVYAPKADANHGEVAAWYEQSWCLVEDVHKLPNFVDLIVKIPTRCGGILQKVEIKTTDGKLSPKQERRMREWGPSVYVVVRTEADVREHVERVQGRFK